VQPGGTGAATAEVWATEHGPQGGDELNRIVPGRNYGWPVITYGVNYGTGTKIGEGVEKLGLEQPIFFWKPSIAPSGLTRLVDSRFGSWRGSFLGGALAGQGLSRFVLGEGVAQPPDRATIPAHPTGRLVEEEYLLANVLGRIRDVRTGPDGLVYLTIDSAQGHLYRLEPRGN
jgi:glucose/arabinose dehydrogenase